jgi:hypothetical protein
VIATAPPPAYPSRRSLRAAREVSERTGVQIAVTVTPDPVEPVVPDPGLDSMVIVPPAPVAPIVNAPATLRRRDLRAAARVNDNKSAFRRDVPDAADPSVGRNEMVEAVVVDPTGDTGPTARVDGDLDWLSPSRTGPVPRLASIGDATARLASIRPTMPGPEVRRTAVTRWLPQAGVVAVMAAATVGNSLAGPFAHQTPRIQSAFAPQRDGVPVDLGSPDAPVVSDLDASSEIVADSAGLLRVRGAEEASRSSDRSPLPSCDGVPPEIALTNGNVPDEFLCVLPNGHDRMRADAAVAFALLNQAYAAHFGREICVTSSYRTYAEQAVLRRQKPGLAARAGASEHGFGLAVDLCGGVENAGEEYWWLRENAIRFGFDNPNWARKGGGKYEPWHWEYVNGMV